MRLSIISIFCLTVYLLSCNKKDKTSTNVDLKTGKWVAVTQLDNEWVQFKPCDADNSTIELTEKSLIINWGLSTEDIPVESVIALGDGKYEITSGIDSLHTEKAKYAFQTLPDGKTKWWLLGKKDTASYIYVDEAKAKDYKITEQPCIECWSSEECAQMAGSPDLKKFIGSYVLEKSNGLQILTIESVEGIDLSFSINNTSKTDCFGELKGNATVEYNQAVYRIDGCTFDLVIMDNKIEIKDEMCESQNPNCKFSGVYIKTF